MFTTLMYQQRHCLRKCIFNKNVLMFMPFFCIQISPLQTLQTDLLVGKSFISETNSKFFSEDTQIAQMLRGLCTWHLYCAWMRMYLTFTLGCSCWIFWLRKIDQVHYTFVYVKVIFKWKASFWKLLGIKSLSQIIYLSI